MPSKDRVEHVFGGSVEAPGDTPCTRCGRPLFQHRPPRQRVDIRYRDERVYTKRRKIPKLILGIDGEGQGRSNHIYNMMCASSEDGEHQWSIEDENGLHTEELLEFITSFPKHSMLFAYSFNYDITKILEDLDEKSLYYLARPDLRQRFGKDAYKGPRPVIWRGWRLNLQGTKFTVRKNIDRNKPATIIWDIWKFYQSKFTNALEDWKVGTEEEIERMKLMKDKRHLFDQESPDAVRAYCFSECRLMAQLAHRLMDAHVDAGIPLKNFYGAGSSATGLLKKMGVKEHIKEPPEEMIEAVSQAFFGGRFDNSVVGTIKGKVHGWDISSAYPYQTTFLPCLTHGTWELTKNRRKMESARVACVHYSLRRTASVNTRGQKPEEVAWGPFPFRTPDGSICYPAVSGGGWVWRDEFLEGEKLFHNVEFLEAWVYNTDCMCHPFKDIPYYYSERIRIGKEGPGIVIKLGLNSVYGKTAQSVGSGQFRSWVWAGLDTSGCRSQVLTALGLHKDWANMLMVATDGILTLEDLVLPKPKYTGTDHTGKPLGGWEYKASDRGVFIARAGVYFPLNPSQKDIKTVRGRGVGRGVILENWEKIISTWETWNRRLVPADYDRPGFDHAGWPIVKVANVSRFCGIKTSISRSLKDGKFVYKRAGADLAQRLKPRKNFNQPPRYGQWITREVAMSFNPAPKRASIAADGRSLTVRCLPEDRESMPYKKANISEEARQLMLRVLEENEQPDQDMVDYEYND